MRHLWVSFLLVAVILVSACNSPAKPAEKMSISLADSTTVQPVAEKLAEAFKAANPSVQIDVQGGGSSVGVKSAGEGTVDSDKGQAVVEEEGYLSVK
jgi:phosphate transport system substrate-binding protein